MDVVLVGFPFSEGAVRNGGRDGASAGPDFFRRMYPGMGALHNPEHGIDLQDHLTVVDWGDIPKSGQCLSCSLFSLLSFILRPKSIKLCPMKNGKVVTCRHLEVFPSFDTSGLMDCFASFLLSSFIFLNGSFCVSSFADVFEDAHKRLRADIADIIKAGQSSQSASPCWFHHAFHSFVCSFHGYFPSLGDCS